MRVRRDLWNQTLISLGNQILYVLKQKNHVPHGVTERDGRITEMLPETGETSAPLPDYCATLLVYFPFSVLNE